VRGFNIIWRAIRDTFDHVLSYMLGSLVWWLVAAVPFFLVLSVAVFLPPVLAEAVALLGAALGAGPATALLAKWVDPRLVVERPVLADLVPWARQYARPAWAVSALVFLATGVLALNLRFYSVSASAFSLLVPLWVFLLVLSVVVTFVTLSLVSLTDATPRQAFRRAGYVIASAPFQSLLLFAWVVVTIVGGASLVVPLVLVTPPLILAATNRLVLNQLQIAIPDPNAPTDERVVERKTGADKRADGKRRGLFSRG
jgi:hypothetical protein